MDIHRMKRALESESVPIPPGLTREQILAHIQGAPLGFKFVGWTCGEADCGRVHETGDADGYMRPVYVLS